MSRPRASFVFALMVFLHLGVPHAIAQESESDVRLRLMSQPIWHDPGDGLGFKVRVENSSLSSVEGFILRIEGHQRLSSRSALHESFTGEAGFSASSFSKFFSDKTIPSGTGRAFVIDEPLRRLTSLATATEGGIYPVTVSLFDAQSNAELDSFTTPLIYYPSKPELPLNLVLVIPLNEVPNRTPTGTFESEADISTTALETALDQEEGWLRGLLDALRTETAPIEPEPKRRSSGRTKGEKKAKSKTPAPEPPPPLKAALAPTPRFIEELADMANGYRKTTSNGIRTIEREGAFPQAAGAALRDLRDLMQTANIQSILVPYSFPDLPSLGQGLPLETGLGSQLVHARDVLGRVLDVQLAREWIFPPAGRLDQSTIEDLRFSAPDFRHTFVTEDSFDFPTDVPPEGCPAPSPSFTCPVLIDSAQRPVSGFITDTGIQTRFTQLGQDGDARLSLQNLFAETAMIREETPGLAGRVVQATVPSLWHPHPRIWKLLMNGLRVAPWLRTVTPDGGLEGGVKPAPRSLLTTSEQLEAQPSEDLFNSILETQDLVDSFKLVRPPEQLAERLSRNLLVAQSRVWGATPLLAEKGSAYVARTLSETQSELNKITIGGIEEIRLTSRRGEIPIEVFNDTDYDVAVQVRVVSPRLRLDETLPQILQPGRFRQITMDVETRASGIFPVEVAVQTPDGSYDIDFKSIRVRSTEFNQVALVITLGALAFLVLFYVLRAVRRRQPGEAPA